MNDAAEATLRQYARFLDERTGVFASLRSHELPWESPIHVCAGDLKPEFCSTRHRVRPAISATVSGSGLSALEAKASCLCEALERHSGIFRGDESRQVASYSELGDEAIHPEALTQFSESQYKNREQWNQVEGRYNWVPERFDCGRSIDWSPAHSLTQNQTKYLPTAYCYFGYPFDPAHDFCRPDSNGNAAGSSLDEAIIRGFLELVERECVAVWWYNRVRRPRVDIDSFGMPDLAAVRSLYRLLGRSVEVLDITAHRNIPTFVAVSRSEDQLRDDFILGFGAHFDPPRALTKALMEMSQLLPIVLSGRKPVCYLNTEPSRGDASFLTPYEKIPATTGVDCSAPQEANVLSCIEMVKSWGLEMLVLNQTRKDVGMPVVKVVVPGMCSWWARFGNDRLYTLPVQLGWLSGPKTEPQMNSAHLIF